MGIGQFLDHFLERNYEFGPFEDVRQVIGNQEFSHLNALERKTDNIENQFRLLTWNMQIVLVWPLWPKDGVASYDLLRSGGLDVGFGPQRFHLLTSDFEYLLKAIVEV